MKKSRSSFLSMLINKVISVYTRSLVSFRKDSLDRWLATSNIKRTGMLGLDIMQNGEVIYSNSSGYAKISDTNVIPKTSETTYRIGSITKVFTATMVYQLIEDGKLHLHTPLATFFPSVTNASKITIANLLNHSSGLFDFTADLNYIIRSTSDTTREDHLKYFETAPVFEPGTQHEYSNTNFVLLGFIIEDLDGIAYEDCLRQRITEPLSLVNTSVGENVAVSGKEAYSYRWKEDWVQQTKTNLSIAGGAGSIISNPRDLVTFLHALFSNEIISAKSLKQMTDLKSGFGMGIFAFSYFDERGYGHIGGIDGFYSQMVYFPRKRLAVALTINGSISPINETFIKVLQRILIPGVKKIQFSESSNFDKYAGRYATTEVPLKIDILKNDEGLYVPLFDDAYLTLIATNPDVFTSSDGDITLTFSNSSKKMTMRQGKSKLVMSKESSSN